MLNEQLDLFGETDTEYFPQLDLEALYRFAREQAQLHWQREFDIEIELVDRDWRNTAGMYVRNLETGRCWIRMSSKRNKMKTWEQVKGTLLHELVHWHLHTSGIPHRDSDIEFARECMRVGAPFSETRVAQKTVAIAKAVEDYELRTFDQKLRAIVMDAVKFLDYEEYLDETTEISVSCLDTSEKNKYFREGCAMMHLYLYSDKASTSLCIANEHALKNHLDWVEFRSYDHRYFKEYSTGLYKHSDNKPPLVSLENTRRCHFHTKIGETYFCMTNQEQIEQVKRAFFEWGFVR